MRKQKGFGTILVLITTLIIAILIGIYWLKTKQSTSDPSTPEAKACGGFAGEKGEFKCPEGYRCEYPKPTMPDTQGRCVRI